MDNSWTTIILETMFHSDYFHETEEQVALRTSLVGPAMKLIVFDVLFCVVLFL